MQAPARRRRRCTMAHSIAHSEPMKTAQHFHSAMPAPLILVPNPNFPLSGIAQLQLVIGTHGTVVFRLASTRHPLGTMGAAQPVRARNARPHRCRRRLGQASTFIVAWPYDGRALSDMPTRRHPFLTWTSRWARPSKNVGIGYSARHGYRPIAGRLHVLPGGRA